jgi:hypothetical protein
VDKIRVGNTDYEPRKVIENAVRGCGWFRLVAVFSLINTVLHLFKADLTFVVGLGATQFIDGVIIVASQEMTGGARTAIIILGTLVNVSLAGVFLGIWRFSKAGSRVAYVLGMILYLLDGLLFVWLGDWVGIGFHAFFLFMMLGGYHFASQRRTAEALLSEAETPIDSPPASALAAPAQSEIRMDSAQERPTAAATRRPPVVLILTGLCFLFLGAKEIASGTKLLIRPRAEIRAMPPPQRTGFLVGRAARVSVLGVLPVVCGIGLLALRPWARIGLLVYLPIAAIPTALFSSRRFAQGVESGFGTNEWNSVSFVLCLLVILSWYGVFFLYLCRRRTKSLFLKSVPPPSQ